MTYTNISAPFRPSFSDMMSLASQGRNQQEKENDVPSHGVSERECYGFVNVLNGR